MVLLVLFPGVAHLGTTNGMRLFFDNLFPYLLPYFILTHWILLLSRPIANSTFSVLIRTYILSAFGGFPTGAVILNQMVLNDEISKKQAAYLLPICHNPSPIFVSSCTATVPFTITPPSFASVPNFSSPVNSKFPLTKETFSFVPVQ